MFPKAISICDKTAVRERGWNADVHGEQLRQAAWCRKTVSDWDQDTFTLAGCWDTLHHSNLTGKDRRGSEREASWKPSTHQACLLRVKCQRTKHRNEALGMDAWEKPVWCKNAMSRTCRNLLVGFLTISGTHWAYEELPGKSRWGSSIQQALVKQRHTPGRGALSAPYTAVTVPDGTAPLVLRKPWGTKFPRGSSSTSWNRYYHSRLIAEETVT